MTKRAINEIDEATLGYVHKSCVAQQSSNGEGCTTSALYPSSGLSVKVRNILDEHGGGGSEIQMLCVT